MKCFLLGLSIILIVASTHANESSNHWAFSPLRSIEPPKNPQAEWCRTPVDAFILSRLNREQLRPAAEADKRTLVRRVYFDLIGLPPTPEEVESFLKDPSPKAYEKLVDRLLDSPRYGERWARHWMDAVHFAETHGHDQDRIRTNAWPYRDYLIKSFNDDKSYSRFVQEQVAGDVLFPEDPAATVALGFLAAGPWDESSLRDIREDTLDRQIARYLDRDDIVTTVMSTFTSTTVHCARCHDHKFDPIPQKDYYALQAVFAGVDRANRVYDREPSTFKKRHELLALKKKVEQGDRSILLGKAGQEESTAWEREFSTIRSAWKTLDPQLYISANGTLLQKQDDGSLLATGPRPERETYTISAGSPLPKITAIRLEVLTHTNFPKQGPGRQDNGNLHLTEIQLQVFDPKSTTPREIRLANASADFEESGQSIDHVLDRDDKTDWGIYPKVGESHQAVFELKEPLQVSPDATLVIILKQLYASHTIGRPRLSVTSAKKPVQLAPISHDLEMTLATPAAKRSEAERSAVARVALLRRISRELGELPKPSLVYAAAADYVPDGSMKPSVTPRPVHLLRRGEITKPLEEATPGALACVADIPSRFSLENAKDEGIRRAALATWLTQTNNVLAWRSVVNRVWQHHFGRGLVETPNDFGKMGSAPSHPELLDWLAVWFRDEARGSWKALHRLLVTSAVYRQSSHGGSALDSGNRLLSHANRVRLDAEQVRDSVLQVSGRLDPRMGGPSDMQFDLQPGIHVTPKVDYAKFDLDSNSGRRRGVYRFIFRTLPDPFMDALDCPAGDQLTPTRNASVTVQQALALWNDAFIARHAEHLAGRLEKETEDPAGRIQKAFTLLFSRPATSEETAEFSTFAAKHGMANLCRVLLNSNEFMFLN
ncbi:MAG TPA: DUF1549 and DUF1553 domain-containing protein [Candidatus Saccharimonadales bacterium]|nr:DUF1549 and DUF1553 domain-containing protein [Candidatus Saccharimonadales bacterium]